MIRKFFLLFTLLTGAALSSFAQRGSNQVGVAFDLGLPVGDFHSAYKTGFGGQLRGLYGVGTSGQVSLTTGYTSFKGEFNTTLNYNGYTFSILPVLAGYRQHFSMLFVEPQLGISRLRTKFPGGEYHEGKFTYAIGAGYATKMFELGVRYQSAADLGQVAFHIGYNIPVGGKK